MSGRRFVRRALFWLGFCGLLGNSRAATSTAWEVNGFQELLKGRLSGLSLTVDGMLEPGPATRFNVDLDQPAAWSIAQGPDGNIYVGTGHQGKVLRVSPDGKPSVIWSSSQSEVFAICVDSRGNLYAGTSPNGAVYRIEKGGAQEVWKSPAKYIWALEPAPDGALFVATGEGGQIYRISPQGQTETYYSTEQVNVTSLALGPSGQLYAGTEPNGLLYQISSQGKGTVLYDSSLPEIRSLAVAPDGTVYAAAMGGAVASRPATGTPGATATPTSTVTATSPTVITVTESAAQNNDQQTATNPQTQVTSSLSTGGTTAPATSPVTELSGVEKSALYKITPDHVVQNLRSSKEDNIYDLKLDGDSILFSTDVHGRIYRLTNGKLTLLSELADGETTRIFKSGSVLYAAMSNPGRLFALGASGSRTASYQSQVHDSTSVARWGHLQWHAMGSDIVFRTRSGYSARPDATWSQWSSPITKSGMELIPSPPSRFVQWRAEWPAASKSQLDSVSVPYLPQNTPPAVHSITVTGVVGTNAAKSGANAAAANSAYSITVTDTGEAPAASSGTTANQTVSRLQTTQTQISWQADDPDGDKLAYTIYFRPEGATEWQLIRSRIPENTMVLDADVFADGRYYFRVVASDAPSNAPEFARQAELVSTPVLIDNTPPAVSIGTPQRNGTTLDIDVEGNDQTSPLRLCEYSLDAGGWQPIESVDGVTDSPHGKFHLHLDNLRPGEHLLVFRIYDAANNAGLGRVILH